MTPQRIQLRRVRGWRMPENTVVVSRPSRWGNPWTITDLLEEWQERTTPTLEEVRATAAENYRAWLSDDGADMGYPAGPGRRERILRELPTLRGWNLACWCPLPAPGQPDHCHAAVLLTVANAGAGEGGAGGDE
ncbi:DUF4326 domain-containing protein [Roseomonas sp. NAR14]|uniref:DUF4326 domain-containing protein n=1 Tax=Roseomonas acroporae TaxID=2937791 RepID=A0A9X1YES9_9PROT|nr:DUF4326 domain-containing protein [Roseomonas acroporae]